jgi:hypothetical protein
MKDGLATANQLTDGGKAETKTSANKECYKKNILITKFFS